MNLPISLFSIKFKFDFIYRYWPYYLEGFKNTLMLAFWAVVFGTVLGAVIGLMRLSKHRIPRTLASWYINFIRGTPNLVQIYIIYYGMPFRLSDYTAAIIALTINASAYIAETVRAGIEAVDKGQMEAARSLGLSHVRSMWHVVIPQAIKNILPALCNEFIIVTKNTSIMSVIGVQELMYNTDTVRSNTYLAFEPLMIAAVMYFLVSYVLKRLIGIMERRLKASD